MSDNWQATGDGVKALFFDVFGTLVDWRGGIARESERLLTPRGVALDWFAFAEAWRGEYKPSMAEVQEGRIPFAKLDILHRRNLERILPRFGIGGLPEETMRDLTTAWHRLPAWPDVSAALARLKRRFLLAPVSNGNISLMAHLARHNGFAWDTILGAEIARDYKPKPAVYLAAVAALDLDPHECMMVAAHSYDLQAAAGVGLRTGHVARPNEAGPGTGEAAPAIAVDVAGRDLGDRAERLGASRDCRSERRFRRRAAAPARPPASRAHERSLSSSASASCGVAQVQPGIWWRNHVNCRLA